MSKAYLNRAARAVGTPPQSDPLDNRQVPNSAGGYAYPVDEWVRLDRFLILGSEGGSYYADEQTLTKENLDAVAECTAKDGMRVVRRIVEISDKGRAPKNDPALLALAYVASESKDVRVRQEALDAIIPVARIGTHLFHFISFVQEFRGWGSALKKAVAQWYLSKDANKLADQVTKYQQRDGFSHADAMRLCHVKFPDGPRNAIARWVHGVPVDAVRELFDKEGNIARQYSGVGAQLPRRIEGHIKLQAAKTGKEAAKLIREYGLVRESVPTELLSESVVWDALLDDMPMTALIRNLGNLSKNEVLKPLGQRTQEVVRRLTSRDDLREARVHPIQLLLALKTYETGHSLKGKGTWNVVPQIVDALDAAYYTAFDFVEPTNKRYYLGLDISGSMWSGCVAGISNFTPVEASGAMAMVTIKAESNFYVAGFTTADATNYGGMHGGRGGLTGSGTNMTLIKLSKNQRLDDVCQTMQGLRDRMGGTDCALPMLDAIAKKLEVDVFAIYTDSETWHGHIHPMQALREYRQKMGIAAKLVIVSMVGNKFSIADPRDSGTMDVVGFDSATPSLIADFARQ